MKIFNLMLFLFILLSLESSPLQLLPKKNTRPSPNEDSELKSEYYTFTSPLKNGETRKIMHNLDSLAETLLEVYGLEKFAAPKPSITLFQNKKEYFEHIRKYDIQGVKYSGGYFNPLEQKIALYWQGSREATLAVIFHEVTHCFTMKAFRDLPQALNEGFSTYMETAALDPKKCVFGTVAPQYAPLFISMAGKNQIIPLHRFLSLRGYGQQTIREVFGEKEYAQAWALVWFCLHGSPETLKDFKSYLRELRQHPDPEGKQFLRTVVKNEQDFLRQWKHAFEKKRVFKNRGTRELSLD